MLSDSIVPCSIRYWVIYQRLVDAELLQVTFLEMRATFPY